MKFLNYCLQPVQKQEIFLLFGLHTCPRIALTSPSRAFLIYSRCKFFQNNLHLSFSNPVYKGALSAPGWWTYSSFPTSPADVGSHCTSQDLVLFLATIWLNKRFLPQKLSAMKVLFKINKQNGQRDHILTNYKEILRQGNKEKNKHMGLHQTKKLLPGKRSHQQSERGIHCMGEHIC